MIDAIKTQLNSQRIAEVYRLQAAQHFALAALNEQEAKEEKRSTAALDPTDTVFFESAAGSMSEEAGAATYTRNLGNKEDSASSWSAVFTSGQGGHADEPAATMTTHNKSNQGASDSVQSGAASRTEGPKFGLDPAAGCYIYP